MFDRFLNDVMFITLINIYIYIYICYVFYVLVYFYFLLLCVDQFEWKKRKEKFVIWPEKNQDNKIKKKMLWLKITTISCTSKSMITFQIQKDDIVISLHIKLFDNDKSFIAKNFQ